MNLAKQSERRPRPAAELKRLAEYDDTHDTSAEMEHGDWPSHSRWQPHPCGCQPR